MIKQFRGLFRFPILKAGLFSQDLGFRENLNPDQQWSELFKNWYVLLYDRAVKVAARNPYPYGTSATRQERIRTHMNASGFG